MVMSMKHSFGFVSFTNGGCIGVPHKLSYSSWISIVSPLIVYKVIPMVMNKIPKMAKIIIVEPKEGMGLKAGSYCCLNLLCLSFSIFY